MSVGFPYTLKFLRDNIVLDYFEHKYRDLPSAELMEEARAEYIFVFGEPPPSRGTISEQYDMIRQAFSDVVHATIESMTTG